MTVADGLRALEPAECLAAIEAVTADLRVSADVLDALGECLGNPKKLVQRCAADAFAVLYARGVPVHDTLRACLRAPAARQRWGAVFALAKIGLPLPEALPVLLDSLGDADGDVRWAAADILLRMPGTPQLSDALRSLLRDGNTTQRKMAAYCLRDLTVRSPAVEGAMLVALDDGEPSVRMAAMSALAHLSTERVTAAERLTALLGDADAGVRRAAAALLGRLGQKSPTVLAALGRALRSADPSLRRAAQRSLQSLDPHAAPNDGVDRSGKQSDDE